LKAKENKRILKNLKKDLGVEQDNPYIMIDNIDEFDQEFENRLLSEKIGSNKNKNTNISVSRLLKLKGNDRAKTVKKLKKGEIDELKV
jgi:hypothetical protein